MAPVAEFDVALIELDAPGDDRLGDRPAQAQRSAADRFSQVVAHHDAVVGVDVDVERDRRPRVALAARPGVIEGWRERPAGLDQVFDGDVFGVGGAAHLDVAGEDLQLLAALKIEKGVGDALRIARVFDGDLIDIGLQAEAVEGEPRKRRAAVDADAAAALRRGREVFDQGLVGGEAYLPVTAGYSHREIDDADADVAQL